jgi:hypothetical protein
MGTRRLAIAVVSVLALSGTAAATPSRVGAIDAGNFLVPDDWDLINFYSLAPEFADHVYVYDPLSGRPYGWATVDVKPVGTFVLWLNLPSPVSPVFRSVSAFSALGFTTADLDEPGDGLGAWDPGETRVADPDLKLALGIGRRFGDTLSVGLCTRIGRTDATDSHATTGGSVVGLLSDASFVSTYLLFSASLTGYSQHQRSSVFVLGPSVSWKGEALSVDAYAAYVGLGVDNTWDATLLPDAGAGFTGGSLHRALEFDGKASWQGRAKVLAPLSEQTTLACFGQYASLDLSTKHTMQAAFTGTGLSAVQRAGVNHVDGMETLTQAPWNTMAGVLTRVADVLVVFGLGANGGTIQSRDTGRSPRAGGASLNDTVETLRASTEVTTLGIPALFGVEYSALPWLRLRAVAQRNLIGWQKTVTSSAADTNADGVMDTTVTDSLVSHAIEAWVLRAGFGLANDRIGWDVLFDFAPSDADYISPFATAPATATWHHPAFTTSVVFKW